MPKKGVRKTKPHIEAFNFWYCDLQESSSGELVGYSPFADAKKKLYVNPETGQWSCKVSGESGNAFTFLAKLYEQMYNATPDELYEGLSTLRKGLPVEYIADHAPAWDGSHWVFPVRNRKGSIINLRRWNPKAKKPVMIGTSSMDNTLYGIEQLEDDTEQHVFLAEGEFDRIALEAILYTNSIDGIVISLPGVTTFKKGWEELFRGKHVYLCFDNDSTGQSHVHKHGDRIAKHAAGLYYLRWTPNFADKYDINDLLADRLNDLSVAWSELEAMLQEVEVKEPQPAEGEDEEGEPTVNGTLLNPDIIIEGNHIRLRVDFTGIRPITSFATVLKHYRQNMYLSSRMVDGLAVAYATTFAVQIPGDPLWLFLIAPPGSGKTLILESLAGSAYAFYQSRIRATSIVSGYKTPDGSDPSLLNRFMGKCVIFKDWTEISSMPRGDQDDLYGLLRGAFDGRVDIHFGNGLDRVYDPCYFGVLAGVTDVIHRDRRATLGERFLKYDLIGDSANWNGYKPEIQIRAAINNAIGLTDAEAELEHTAKAFTSRELNLKKLPSVPVWAVDKIIALSQVVGALRATVDRGGGGELSYRPRVEVSTRLSTQLVKLARGLCVVYNKSKVDKDVYRILQQVAFDTATGWNLDIFKVLVESKHSLTRMDIAVTAQMPDKSVERRLEDLLQLRVASFKKVKVTSGRGAPAFLWTADARLKILWKKATI